MQAYFVSDIHLRSDDEKNAQIFVRFLNRLQDDEKATHLFLVGDIFDFWISDHSYFISKFSNVVHALDSLVQKGVEVHYFEGNHDLHLEKYWSRKIGIKVHKSAEYFELNGMSVRVEHGDLIDPEDKGYLFLKSVLQTKATKFIADNMNEKVVAKIGEKASQASRHYTSTQKTISSDENIKKHRAYAEKVFQQRSYDLLISGHIHIKDDYIFQIDGNDKRAVNLGSWYDQPKVFILSEKSAEFETLV